MAGKEKPSFVLSNTTVLVCLWRDGLCWAVKQRAWFSVTGRLAQAGATAGWNAAALQQYWLSVSTKRPLAVTDSPAAGSL
jgi:hypothetical protein